MTPLEKIDKETLKELYDKDFPLWAEINYMLLKEKAYELYDPDRFSFPKECPYTYEEAMTKELK